MTAAVAAQTQLGRHLRTARWRRFEGSSRVLAWQESAKGQRKQQIVLGASAKTRNSKEGKSSGLAVTPRRQIEQLEMSR
ncbi:hypothetical protein WR25_15907 [Diploscapter pachys]|uniref:Uncharacterized protein n=1 Tax=Diploscapter pachys TaxID=2018661 RepID=A0A2A2J3A2_9BILA|nr:hypothetical protein WR25_15907 [Diploscapter pachys]